MNEIIEPQTAVDSKILRLGPGIFTISSGKLTGVEVVTFQIVEDGVNPPGDLYQDGTIRQITPIHNVMTIQGPIDVQVTKSVTSLPVGVYFKG